VSLVGYTNAGKSTLMNRLTDASVPAEDKLFATLDPTVRRLKLPSGREILLSDTVGFVRKLPHQLVDSFRATFEEVESSSLLLHVIDASHPHAQEQTTVVDAVLEELGLHRKPQLRVFNKSDLGRNGHGEEGIALSALTGQGVESLLEAIDRKLSETFRFVILRIPYDAGSALSILYRTGRVLKREDRPDGIRLEAVVDEKHYSKFLHFQER
jgi:GTP-binding protein HflX